MTMKTLTLTFPVAVEAAVVALTHNLRTQYPQVVFDMTLARASQEQVAQVAPMPVAAQTPLGRATRTVSGARVRSAAAETAPSSRLVMTRVGSDVPAGVIADLTGALAHVQAHPAPAAPDRSQVTYQVVDAEVPVNGTPSVVRALILASPTALTAKEIIARTGLRQKQVESALWKLRDIGSVRSVATATGA